MKTARNLFLGLLSVIASSLIVLGGLSLALLEGQLPFSPTARPPANTATRSLAVTLSSTENTRPPSPSPVVVTATHTATPLCPPPRGWVPYVLQPDDTYEQLAEERGTSVERLVEGNCLPGPVIMEGSILYIPPLREPTPTKTPRKEKKAEEPEPDTSTPVPPTSVPCGPPDSWVPYTVRSGDTLSRLAREYGTSVYTLQVANCLVGSDLIYAGQTLYLPKGPSRTPTRTATEKPEPTNTRKPSATPNVAATQAEQTARAEQKTLQSLQETEAAAETESALATQLAETITAEAKTEEALKTRSAEETNQSETLTAAAPPPPEPSGSLPAQPPLSARVLSWLMLGLGGVLLGVRRLL